MACLAGRQQARLSAPPIMQPSMAAVAACQAWGRPWLRPMPHTRAGMGMHQEGFAVPGTRTQTTTMCVLACAPNPHLHPPTHHNCLCCPVG